MAGEERRWVSERIVSQWFIDLLNANHERERRDASRKLWINRVAWFVIGVGYTHLF